MRGTVQFFNKLLIASQGEWKPGKSEKLEDHP